MLENRVVARSAALVKRGTKQTCQNETCGSPYYDLRRVPPTCPFCGTASNAPAIARVDFDTLGKLRPRRSNRWAEPTKPTAEVSKVESDEVDAAEEQGEDEPAIPSTAEDLLIEIEDDDEVEAPGETDTETT